MPGSAQALAKKSSILFATRQRQGRHRSSVIRLSPLHDLGADLGMYFREDFS